MLEGLTSKQLAEWTAYAAVEPFGEERSDYRLAYALAVIVNLFKGKDGPPVKVSDFIPKVGVLAVSESDEQAGDEEDVPPMHPNVVLWEQMMGVT